VCLQKPVDIGGETLTRIGTISGTRNVAQNAIEIQALFDTGIFRRNRQSREVLAVVISYKEGRRA
jgi:hypothetical protein